MRALLCDNTPFQFVVVTFFRCVLNFVVYNAKLHVFSHSCGFIHTLAHTTNLGMGKSSVSAARGHAMHVDGEILNVTKNKCM